MKIDTAWIDGWLKDLRYAASSLVARPGFTAMALLALVVGIALNVGVFTAINALLTRQWNVPEPERVVNAYAFNPKLAAGYWDFPLAGIRFLNDNSRTVEGAFAARGDDARLTANGVESGATVAYVTGNFFDVARRTHRRGPRVPSRRGRFPRAGRGRGHQPLALDRTLRGDPAVIGRTVEVDGIPFTIIGIAAEGFDGIIEFRTDVWLPFAAVQLVQPTDPALFDDATHCCSSLSARLRPGVSREEATAEWNTLYGEYLRGLGLEPPQIVLTGTAMLDHPQRRQQVAALFALVIVVFGAVLLLACANVTNLLLARARRGSLRSRCAWPSAPAGGASCANS